MRVWVLQYHITQPYEIRSEREFNRALCQLFRSAYENDIDIGTTATWVCRHGTEPIPDREVMCFELEKAPLDG
jgi:hypothetical protein